MSVQLPIREKAFLVLHEIEKNWELIRAIIKIRYKTDVSDVREARKVLIRIGRLLEDDAYVFGAGET